MALVALAEPLLVAGCTEEAIQLYTQALAIAHMAMGKGEPKGWEVLRSAQLGMAGALAAAQRWQQAAGQYVVLAMQSFGAEPVVELECRRMAAWCYESLGEPDRAWEHTRQAWTMGKTLREYGRDLPSLPYVAAALVRLSRRMRGDLAAQRAQAEADSVLGKGWASRLQGPASPL